MKIPIVVLLLCVCAAGQSTTTAVLQVLADGVDAAATERNASNVNFRELDPVDRVFVSHGPALLAGFFAADAAAKIVAPRWLAHHHHEKLGRVVSWAGLAATAWGIETSLRGYHK